MLTSARKVIRHIVRAFGYDIVPIAPAYLSGASSILQVREVELAYCNEMRKIHCRDAKEIEDLYRHFVFPSLPRSAGRPELLNELIGTSVGEAIYIVHYLHASLAGPGDICEFGVAQGATSRLLAAEILTLGQRKLWLFDSFQGLPAPGAEDKLKNDIFNLGSMRRYEGTMASHESEVIAKLNAIGFPQNRTKIKKGWFGDVIKSDDLPRQVAFAYVDFDFYEPIKQVLQFLGERMCPGGHIIVDDYGYFSEGAERAVDEFLSHVGASFKFERPLSIAGHFCILSKLA
jgi:hypothetical protein